MARAYVSMILALSLTGNSAAGAVVPVGMVIHADRAHVGDGSASAGTTLYEGDQLRTETAGELGVRSSAAALQLEQETGVTLGKLAPGEKGISAELAWGTLVFSASGASAVVVRANGALIRVSDDGPTIAHVRVVGPKELRVFAQRGGVEFLYRDESEVIPEGACYRVLLDVDADDNPANSGRGGAQAQKIGLAHRSFVFISIAAGAAAAATLTKSHHPHPHPHESPDRP